MTLNNFDKKSFTRKKLWEVKAGIYLIIIVPYNLSLNIFKKVICSLSK